MEGILIGLAALLVATVVIGGAVAWARPRALVGPPRTRVESAPAEPLDIALLHGAFGFDEIVVRSQRHAYFHGVAQHLSQLGRTVHTPAVHPAAGVVHRAKQLTKRVRDLPGERLCLIAHSMGGLDARYALAHLGLSDRVAALITIGTPHRGTPLADATDAVSKRVGLHRLLPDGGAMLSDLTTERMERFNKEVPNVPGVFYGSVIGRVDRDRHAPIHPLLLPTHRLLRTRHGDNDGLVTSQSQEWGEVLMVVDADHWAQIGWGGACDTKAIYAAIASHLERRGL
ncbi:MAG: hypothetical protein KTR31_36040 [Myxococcales bacterium]|nr:hypothetical protein [Myxococcales bacterium]